MSTTSKSPRRVAAAAYHIARQTLPEQSHRYSPKKYTQPQLLVCLVLRVFFKTDYRGIVEILNDGPDLCQVFGLKTVPHFTTLPKASKRLMRFTRARQLLDSTLAVLVPDRHVALAAMDSTGLEGPGIDAGGEILGVQAVAVDHAIEANPLAAAVVEVARDA